MNKKPIAKIFLESGEVIKLELYPEIAPISVENFIKYAESGFYTGTIFHRIISDFMLQGGGYVINNKRLDQKATEKPIKGEFKINGVANDLKHTLGVISMARTNIKDSATSQFFICSTNTPHLDGQYAAFGKAIDETSIANILKLNTVQTGYVGGMSDVPLKPITIQSVEISYAE